MPTNLDFADNFPLQGQLKSDILCVSFEKNVQPERRVRAVQYAQPSFVWGSKKDRGWKSCLPAPSGSVKWLDTMESCRAAEKPEAASEGGQHNSCITNRHKLEGWVTSHARASQSQTINH